MNIRKMQGTRVESHEIGTGTEAPSQVRKMGPTSDKQAKGGMPTPGKLDTGSMKKKATTRGTTGGGKGKKGY